MRWRSRSAILVGYDWGGRAACVVAALWPERVAALVAITGYGIQDIAAAARPAAAEQEYRYWYQWYFHTERGRAGLTANRGELTRLLWRLWSPNWAFDEATLQATTASFDNPDFVDVTIQSYRHRYGNAPGDPAYDDLGRGWRRSRRSRCRRSCCMARMTASGRRPTRSRATGCYPA